MKLPVNSRHWLMPAAWLATVTITFCLGRFMAFIEAPPGSPAAPRSTATSAPMAAAETPASEDRSAPFDSGETFRSPLEEITNGQPLGDWLKNLLGQEDEIARMTGFMRLLENLNTNEELETALSAVLTNFNGWSRSKEFSMLLQKWAQVDPQQAMAFVEKIKDQGAKFGGYRAVLSTWTRRDASAAIAWAETNGNPPEDDEKRDGNWAMATIVGQIAKTDAEWALRLTEGQTLSRARGRMVESVVGQLVSQRGEAAAQEAAINVRDEALRNGMIARLASQLASSDPQGTAQWVTTLPAGEARQRALTELVAQWSEKDATAAATFLKDYPVSPETDESRGRLAQNVLRKDPEGALAWASTISEEKYRTNTVSDLVRNWMRRDAEAAQKWVQSSQLSADLKARFTAPSADRGTRGR